MVPPLRIELSLVGLRVRYATVTSRRDEIVNNFLLRAIPDHTGVKNDTIVYLNVSCQISFIVKVEVPIAPIVTYNR